MKPRTSTLAVIAIGALAAAISQGCSCGSGDTGDTASGGHGGGHGGGNSAHGGSGGVSSFVGPGGNGTGGTGGCQNLECQQVKCGGGATTSLSGTVFAPEGTIPLYNIVVYVPNAPLAAIGEGASCDKCSAALSGDPLVSTVTDTHGHFQLDDVPVGDDIPLVIQVGKWRRELTIPTVAKCVDTPTDPMQTRLPRNQAEGHIPKIGLSTGGLDSLECFLRKLGLDDVEFTPESGTGRINLFSGVGGTNRYDTINGGALFTDSLSGLWPDLPTLMNYDIVLLSCEGDQYLSTNKPPPSLQAMSDYAGAGGRIFASHWHNAWIQYGQDGFPTVANFNPNGNTATSNPPDPFTLTIDQTFPKGIALADWLVNVGASAVNGSITVNEARHSVDSVNNPPAQQWIYGNDLNQVPPNSTAFVEYSTFNTPIGVPDKQQCGRVVLSDLHVSSGDASGAPFPTGACVTTGLSPQEKALLFMLFDLSACVQNDHNPTCPPGVEPCGAGLPACPAGQTCDATGCCKIIPH